MNKFVKLTSLLLLSCASMASMAQSNYGSYLKPSTNDAVVKFQNMEFRGCEVVFLGSAGLHINSINRYFKKKNGIEVVYNGQHYNGQHGEDYVAIDAGSEGVDGLFDAFVERRNACSFSPFK